MSKNQRIKKWVQALRSGMYKQAVGALARPGDDGDVMYCCLGVACVLYNERHLYNPVTLMDKEGSLPDVVAEWYGITKDPKLGAESATTWNDGRDASFYKIAGLVENHLLEKSDRDV